MPNSTDIRIEVLLCTFMAENVSILPVEKPSSPSHNPIVVVPGHESHFDPLYFYAVFKTLKYTPVMLELSI